ncbi:hypothetical protein EDB85DRAFT_1895103 [Lactarius pseudohatsudake]|nr:hypothetical protein EDB85DRAFT_1895103 [Lactarius pseudohatsudake]
MARNTTSAHTDNAACTANHGDAAVFTTRAPNHETEPAACNPKSLTMTTPTLLLSGASQFSNHGSHDDPAAAGTHTTPTRMKIPAKTEAVTVTTTTTTPLRMRPRAQQRLFDQGGSARVELARGTRQSSGARDLGYTLMSYSLSVLIN